MTYKIVGIGKNPQLLNLFIFVLNKGSSV